ncbi:MAG: hypothetical protein HF560_10780 [Synechococcus sp. MIT S9220]|uniref:hypothetical protein n=1 Tax=unclassified Synechococcus TaxID=2626047 RepID=UPI00164B52B0|nr:hypothetical protein [Synechococcus sp. MIT S9220]NOL48044.1 hypothetical protein [Synechococcus sp. MIT S9220]
MGTNYAYSILLPNRTNTESKSRLTVTYIVFSSLVSLIIAGIVLLQVAQNPASEAIQDGATGLFVLLGIIYLYGDSLSEIIWSIHLAEGKFKSVFLRDVWLSLAKGLIPLIGALSFGVIGVIGGLCVTCIINNFVAISLFKDIFSNFEYLEFLKLFSWRDIIKLLKKGIPFFSVPLVSNLILWPLLMEIISSEGIERLDGLRVAQICAQLVGIIGTSLIPILLIKSSQDKQSGKMLHQKSFQACWILSIIIYCFYALSDARLLPLIFGQGPAESALSIARIMVAAAALQGLSQIPMQRPFATSSLLKLSLTQIGSLIISAFISITIIHPTSGLVSYASIGLISPLIIVLCLPYFLRHKLFPDDTPIIPQICISAFLLLTCFSPMNNIIETVGLIICIATAIVLNHKFIVSLRPRSLQS